MGVNFILAGIDIGLYSSSFTFFSNAFTIGVGSSLSALSLAGIFTTPLIGKWLASSKRTTTRLTEKSSTRSKNNKEELSTLDNPGGKESVLGDLKNEAKPSVGESQADPETDLMSKGSDLKPKLPLDLTSNQELTSQPLQLYQQAQRPKPSLVNFIGLPFRAAAEAATFLRRHSRFLADQMITPPRHRVLIARLSASSTTTSLRALNLSSSTLESHPPVLSTTPPSCEAREPKSERLQTEQQTPTSGMALLFYRTLSHKKNRC